jgi:lincosamide nucleotidyltransferase A/C/D/E
MSSSDVRAVLDALEAATLCYSVDGGWGVDALLGWQTRSHDDLDLVIDIEQVDAVRNALQPLGYAPHSDEMPTRFVLAASGSRRIDVHPNYFDETGFAHQRLPGGRVFTCRIGALEAEGRIDGRSVRCLSPALQLATHTGYAPDALDRQDIGRLCRAFDLAPPAGYEVEAG